MPIFDSPYRTWAPGSLRSAWLLDPCINFLNHGSFGARLRVVLDIQDAMRRAVERNPIVLMERERDARLTASRQAAADFVGARLEDLVLVLNATDAANAVVRSLVLDPEDELLTTSQVYNGIRQTLVEVARRAGASYREIELPIPVAGPGEIAERVIAGLGPRTRLLVIDHIASSTALVFPLEEILVAARDRGIAVFVDGAHAPGQVAVDLAQLAELGATYCTGNFHKWPCAPLGSAYLWIHPDHQGGVRPTIISHFRGEGFGQEFRWQATRDLSAWFVLPDALTTLERLVPGGWDAIRGHNRDLARFAHGYLAERLAGSGVLPVAGDPELVGSMTAFVLPRLLRERFGNPVALHDHLIDGYAIEVPINWLRGEWTVRVSTHLHTVEFQIVDFADALERVIAGA